VRTSTRIDLEPAYILHSRAYQETSQILEVFTAGYGRLGLIARGARRPKSSFRGVLNPFQPLHLSWSGKGELQTLRDVDLAGVASDLQGDPLLAAFYVNELLIKLLQRGDPHPELFGHYSSLIGAIAEGEPLEQILRCFELQLLQEIGYALNLERDVLNHEPLEPELNYLFRVEDGAVLAGNVASDVTLYSGATLLAIGRMQFDDANQLREAKRLLRSVLNFHLGNKALQTRRVAKAMKQS
jgi:DNA repair protein RecO (recombination protein O)